MKCNGYTVVSPQREQGQRIVIRRIGAGIGTEVGAGVGTEVGATVGTEVGVAVGTEVGAGVGERRL